MKILTIGALLLATAACGAQSLSDSGSSTAAAKPALDQAPADDQAAAVINAIQPDTALKVPDSIKDGLKITTSVGYPPMEQFATDGKTPVGLDPSLARAIARKLGVKLSITDEEFNSQIPGVLSGRYDFVMSSMSDTKERQAQVTFVDYVKAGAGMLTKGGPVTDVCGKTVSVVDNGSSLKLAETYEAKCKKDGKPAVEILKFPGDQEALMQVSNGRAQVNFTDYVVAAHKAADASLKLTATPVEGTESPWGMGFKPDNKELVDAVKGALDSLIKSGEYASILKAWNLDRLAVQTAEINGGS
ncbi:MAG: ABC transporter substrate-binding protein [Nonomuraea sp.]|nr:ABC transporter substrate-binding protein [Nonomuraea sp.]